jgi:ATP-binding cassette subfamily B protein
MSDIVDNGVITGHIHYIIRIGFVMLAVAIAGSICSVAASLYSSQSAAGFGKLVRENCLPMWSILVSRKSTKSAPRP